MKKATLRIPQGPLKAALDAVRRAVAVHGDIDRAIASLPPVTLETHGTIGMEQRKAKLTEYARDKAEASARAVSALEAAEAEYKRLIDKATVPDGADTQRPDYALFRDGLISTPEQLSVVMARNADSATFRAAALKLATKSGWKEEATNYDTRDRETLLRGFGNEYFQLCRSAANRPGGYDCSLLLSEGFSAEFADKSGVADEYAAGGEGVEA